jgi:queuine tRNA-ribosyltransferase
MPVGTLGTVKAVEQRELHEFDTRIILGNTYHLFLRPGTEVLENAGGLHKFMNWNKSTFNRQRGISVFQSVKIK